MIPKTCTLLVRLFDEAAAQYQQQLAGQLAGVQEGRLTWLGTWHNLR